MTQHGNFCATSEIWTDFLMGTARRWEKCDYFNQFMGFSVMVCVELAGGYKKKSWWCFVIFFNWGQQPSFAFFNYITIKARLSWRLIQQASSDIWYSNRCLRRLSSFYGLLNTYSITWLIYEVHLHKTTMFGSPSGYSTGFAVTMTSS